MHINDQGLSLPVAIWVVVYLKHLPANFLPDPKKITLMPIKPQYQSEILEELLNNFDLYNMKIDQLRAIRYL